MSKTDVEQICFGELQIMLNQEFMQNSKSGLLCGKYRIISREYNDFCTKGPRFSQHFVEFFQLIIFYKYFVKKLSILKNYLN